MRKLTLEETQHYGEELLVSFDRFCAANGLRYYLAYGTLLGAVRHHGFIPWDDDIDVSMPRPDYERLRSLAPPEHAHFIFPDDADSPWPFTKVCDDRTVYDEPWIHPVKGYGVFVDISPLDGCDGLWAPLRARRVQVLWRLYLYAYSRDFSQGPTPTERGFWAKRWVLGPLARLWPARHYRHRIARIASTEKYDECRTVCDFSESTASFKGAKQTDRAIFEHGERIPFDGHPLMAPKDPEMQLERFFGKSWRTPVKAVTDHGTAYLKEEGDK